MNRVLTFIAMGAGLLAAAHAASVAPAAEADLSSHFLTRGEQALLEIVVQGGQPDRFPVIPEVRNLSIDSLGAMPMARLAPDRTRRVDYVYRFRVSSYTKGHFTIPAAELTVAGEKVRTQPVELDILDDMSIQRQEVKLGSRTVGYSAFFQAAKSNPFVGEKIPVELKVYYPYDRSQIVQDWGIPDFERDGISAWRFRPQQNNIGSAHIGAKDFAAASYPSVLSANREGKVKIGPATLRLQTYQAETGTDEAADLTIAPLELNARPLPGGAPETFDNAIGTFKLDVNVADTEVHEGDPVSVTLVISGTGNLDTIKPPKPIDAEGWKLYEAIPNQRGEERTEMSGVIAFTQLMRPLKTQPAIPPFAFSFFNPATEKYETVASTAIPLHILPSTNPPLAGGLATPPKAANLPIEQMTDILGAIKAPHGLLPGRTILPWWAWQMVPALIALALLARIVSSSISSRAIKHPDDVARSRELKEIERISDDRAAFYRAAGHFAERWLGDRKDPEVNAVLSRRDEIAFRPDAARQKVDREERGKVMRTLKKLAFTLILFGAILSPQRSQAEDAPPAQGDTAQKAYDESRYSDAAKLWLESGPFDRLSADTLYNIGNASYRLGSPGEAALYYRRALNRDASHPEARQNLRFLERKFGSIKVERAEYQHLLATIPLSLWKNTAWTGGWLLVIGALTFAATRGAGARVAGVLCLSLAPLLTAVGLVACHYYPDDAKFAPAAEQMVVVSDQAVVRTDAARNAPRVIDAPAGSLCRVLARSGEWTYVEFANDSRGWVPRTEVEPILPSGPPEPPKVHPRAAVDGNNA